MPAPPPDGVSLGLTITSSLTALQTQLEAQMSGTTLTLTEASTDGLPTTQALISQAGGSIVLDGAQLALDDSTSPTSLTITGQPQPGTEVPLYDGSDSPQIEAIYLSDLADFSLIVTVGKDGYNEDLTTAAALHPLGLDAKATYAGTAATLSTAAELRIDAAVSIPNGAAAVPATDLLKDVFPQLPTLPEGLLPSIGGLALGYWSKRPQMTIVLAAQAVWGSASFDAFLAVYKDEASTFAGFASNTPFKCDMDDMPMAPASAGPTEGLSLGPATVFFNVGPVDSVLAETLNTQVGSCLDAMQRDRSDFPSYPASGYGAGAVIGLDLAIGTVELALAIEVMVGMSDAQKKSGSRDDPESPASTGVNQPQYKVYKSPDGVTWLSLQRKFSVLTIHKIGFRADDELGVYLTASVQLGAISFTLIGLNAQFPYVSYVPDWKWPEGVGLAGRFPPVRAAAEVLKVDREDAVFEYDGGAQISFVPEALDAGNARLMALASYAELEGSNAPAFYVFGVFDAPTLPLPTPLTFAGLSLGFGWNSDMTLPTPVQAPQFPLVTAATNPKASQPTTFDGVVELMAAVLTPTDGDYWAAAGASVWLFGFVYADVLITVEFGKTLQFGAIGLARCRLPKGSTEPLAVLCVTVAVIIAPTAGYLQVSATLTPSENYILDPQISISGAAALCVWWGGDRPGDFVITLGGYHPRYDAPSYYPYVPRLGLKCKLGPVTITGQAYFAITPSTIQAGGLLEVSYKFDGIEAYLKAQSDLLIQWQPVYYDFLVGVAVGCSIKLLGRSLLKIEVGADFALSGSPLYGIAKVDVMVITFEITFGTPPGSTQAPAVVDWPTFSDSFLPAADSVCTLQAGTGLVGQGSGTESPAWLFSVDGFSFTARSSIPCTEADCGGGIPAQHGSPFGVAPMAVTSATAPLVVAVDRVTSTQTVAQDLSSWTSARISSAMPAALWGTTQPSTVTPLAPDDELLLDQLVGVQLATPAPAFGECTQASLDDLSQESLGTAPLTIAPYLDTTSTPSAPAADSWQTVSSTVMSEAVVSTRAGIIDAAIGWGATIGSTVALDSMQQDPELDLPWEPRVGALGAFTDDAQGGQQEERADAAAPAVTLTPDAGTQQRPADDTPADDRPRGPVLVAVLRRHRHDRSRSAPSAFGLRERYRVSTRLYSAQGISGRGRSLRAAVEGADLSDAANRITAGCTLLWKAPRGTTLRHLESDGAVAVRILSFDRHQRLLDDRVASGGAHVLPEGTTELAIIGLRSAPAHDDDAAVGWQRTSRLLVVNPLCVIAGRGVLRPQAPVRLRAGRQARRHGVTSGARLSRENRVTTARGPEPGWIEHSLPASTRSLAVLIERARGADSDHADPATCARVTTAPGSGARSDGPLETADIVFDGDRGRLLYQLPSPTVSVRPAPGWELAGVLGFSLPTERVHAEWDHLSLDTEDALHPIDPPRTGELRLST